MMDSLKSSCNRSKEEGNLLLSIAKEIQKRGYSGTWLDATEILHICQHGGVMGEGHPLEYMELTNLLQKTFKHAQTAIGPEYSISHKMIGSTSASDRKLQHPFFMFCLGRAEDQLAEDMVN